MSCGFAAVLQHLHAIHLNIMIMTKTLIQKSDTGDDSHILRRAFWSSGASKSFDWSSRYQRPARVEGFRPAAYGPLATSRGRGDRGADLSPPGLRLDFWMLRLVKRLNAGVSLLPSL